MTGFSYNSVASAGVCARRTRSRRLAGYNKNERIVRKGGQVGRRKYLSFQGTERKDKLEEAKSLKPCQAAAQDGFSTGQECHYEKFGIAGRRE